MSIAIAMLNRPDLIIADEPTTALDVTIQGQVIHEMQQLCKSTKTALLWITHDLAVVAGISNRICVMYAGRIVEQGPNEVLIGNPLHPYTSGLLGSVPSQNSAVSPCVRLRVLSLHFCIFQSVVHLKIGAVMLFPNAAYLRLMKNCLMMRELSVVTIK